MRNRLNSVIFSIFVNMVMFMVWCIFVLVLVDIIRGIMFMMKVIDVIRIGCRCRW